MSTKPASLITLALAAAMPALAQDKPAASVTAAPVAKPAASAGLANDWLRQQSADFKPWDIGGSVRGRYENKQGFGIPLDDWLRGGLKDWVATLLDPAKLNQSGLLKGEAVAKLWRSHLSGRRNAGPQLWTILMLQSWLGDQA